MTTFSTPLTDQLEIDIPILLAPMAGGPTTPELVGAVSNAGAFGQFGAAYLDGAAIHTAAGNIQGKTNKGFGINLFVPEDPPITAEETAAATAAIAEYFAQFGVEPPESVTNAMPDFDEQVASVIESGVKLCSFHLGHGSERAITGLKDAGIVTAASATSVAEAQEAEAAGIDFIIAQGSEAGGHRTTWVGDWQDSMTGTMGLISQLTGAVSIPIIAAGGIMDGRGLAAALALGACGVQMGTAFLTCPEAGVHPAFRQALLDVTDDATVVTKTFSGRPARGLRNRYISEMEKSDAPILPFPYQNTLTGGMRAAATKAADTDFMSMWCGQAASLSRGLPAAELIEQIVEEYQEAANAAFHSSIG
ncbi:MAG: nitronate monooxygenase [Rhodospirillaceae bacterium]|nr:nitronate monooxygenase [Rhodospirillaceae bacterium]|tara:strand:- start:7436 stop:8524 length:1089 start_codon:yes stop_codon:yes gene_type:complete